MIHTGSLAQSEIVLPCQAGKFFTQVRVPKLLWALVLPGVVVSLSGSAHHLLWTRGWVAVVKELSFLIGEEPLRDRKWSSP